MEKLEIEIVKFLNKCDSNFKTGIYNYNDVKKAQELLCKLKKSPNQKNAIYRAFKDKLEIIVEMHNSIENEFFYFDQKISIADYIISMIKEKRLVDPKLIIRFAYLELCKYLYYDISYTKITDVSIKEIIVNTPVNPKTTKIFSYIVCSQWLQLLEYILAPFGIKVKKMTREGEYYTWGEIDLNNGEIVILDGTDYINSSIDLSNAKSTSPTKGFIVLPNSYSGLKFQDLYNKENYKNILAEISKYYDINRELDTSLGIIKKGVYPIEELLDNNPLFNHTNSCIHNTEYLKSYLKNVKNFILERPIPKNIDGYEIYAYYHMFIKRLPKNVRGNISMKTLYVDTYEYTQTRLRRKYLKTDHEYLEYLQELVYSRYYHYLNNNIDNNFFSSLKDGLISGEELTSEILKQELKIAEINRRLNPYYAINELVIYSPEGNEDEEFYQLYEPAVGRKTFETFESELEYKKLNRII